MELYESCVWGAQGRRQGNAILLAWLSIVGLE